MGKDPTTFVASDHGFAPQFLAIDASQPLVDLGLLSKPQTSNCRPATGETIGKAKACWAGGALQIYLNVAGRDPAGGGFQQVAATDVAATVAAIKATYLGLTDPNDWTHDGQPEGWKVIDRAFTKAEARYIPNGPDTTADMAHPTRTGDLVVFAYPPYQFDAETPGTLVAPSHFFGQHGYVPDVQDLAREHQHAGDVPRRRRRASPRARSTARTIDLAPTLAFLLGIPEPQHSQGASCSTSSRAATRVQADLDHRAERLPRPARPDDARRSTGIDRRRSAAPRTSRRCSTRSSRRCPAPGLLLAGRRQRRRLAAELGAAGGHAGDRRRERVGPRRHVVRQPRVRLRRRRGCSRSRRGRTSRSWRRTSSTTATGQRPPWVTPSTVFTVNGVKVGVIGAELENTPELVSAGATAGLKFLDEAPRIKAESERLRAHGVKVQVVVIHEGTPRGSEPDRQRRRRAVGRPDPRRSPTQLQDTTVDAMIVGHTHRISNLMRGNILITEGINAGASYSVLQLMVKGGDVAWAGGATRVAKNLGVAPRADVKAIVDDGERRDGAAPQPGDRHPVDRHPARPDPAQRVGDGQPGRRRDAREVPGRRRRRTRTPAACAQDLRVHRRRAPARQPGEITWGEVFAVLPFGNRTVILTLTGAQLRTAFLNGFSPGLQLRRRAPAASRRSRA